MSLRFRRCVWALLPLVLAIGEAGSDQARLSFLLEIPELSLSVPGDSSVVLGRTDFNAFQIQIRSPSQINYGSIRSRINTESAGIVMETKSVGDAIVCNFDLSRHAGFRFHPGRNSVEIEAVDVRNRVLYASFLLEASAPLRPESTRRPPVALVDIRGSEKYAVIVGVARYKDPAVPSLRFADRDAEAVRDFLLSPEGGHFDPEKMMYLVNEDASLKNLRTALYTFLTQARKQDIVVIYFAGHGSPDPNDRRNLYLLPYDTEVFNMGGSAFPMWEMQDVFARVIKAERIVTFTDACHSAGISGESFRSSSESRPGAGLARDLKIEPLGNNLINQYLARYAGESERAVMTASDIGESSLEGPMWGGGHGVFTHFLIEGLKGKADLDGDGTVTAGELFDYVRQQVSAATSQRQNPTALPGLARGLPLSGRAVRATANLDQPTSF